MTDFRPANNDYETDDDVDAREHGRQQTRRINYMLVLCAILAVLGAVYFLAIAGCEPAPARAAQQAVFGPQKANPGELTRCTLVFLQNNLSKVLLQLADGQVLLDTKEYVIEIQPGLTPVATCKLYRGVYRPSTPVTKTWEVGEIKFVDAEAFQKLIDEAIEYASDDPLPKNVDDVPGSKKAQPPLLPTIPLNPNEKRDKS